MPFRSAHKVVALVVRRAIADGILPAQVTAQMARDAFAQAGLPAVDLDDAFVRRALDPAHFVAIRNIPGGVGRQAAEEMLRELEEKLL
jgi:argininosuccinate lyase